MILFLMWTFLRKSIWIFQAFFFKTFGEIIVNARIPIGGDEFVISNGTKSIVLP